MDLPVWHTSDELFVCTRFIEIRPGKYLAMGRVCDAVTTLPTGNLFTLIETDGEVGEIWQAPPIIWERWVSMANEVLEEV